MKTTIFAIVLALFSGTAFADLPLEIKGLKIGERIDCTILNEIDIREGTFYGRSTPQGCWSKEDEIKSAIVKISFLGYEEQTLIYGVRPDGILAFLIMTSEPKYDWQELPWDFSDAVAAFTKKYGAPTDIVNSVGQNSFGSKFPQKKTIWKRGTQELYVGESLSKVGEVTVTLSDDTLAWAPKVSDDI
ncbi:hypothetical protein [Shewanella baltica]|uniref:hypothetical protein n=1 Tax=Shewanella baltica TaxID=62322 RepID=UPI003D7A1C66